MGALVQAVTTKPSPRLRILAIDDDPGVLNVMKRLLGGTYDLTVASDGEQGLALALLSPPDLILTDFAMPDMTGREVLRRVRQESSLENVPVIVVTSHDETALR